MRQILDKILDNIVLCKPGKRENLMINLVITVAHSVTVLHPAFKGILLTQSQAGGRETVSPVLDGSKGLFVGDVIHEDEPHCSAVVCCRDGPIPLLASCVL